MPKAWHNLKRARARLHLFAVLVCVALCGISLRLMTFGLSGPMPARAATTQEAPAGERRADIVDRNGVLLATSISALSVFADPRDVHDPQATARALKKVLPELDEAHIARRLAAPGSRFAWIERHITDAQAEDILELGLPGVDFRSEDKRIYPQGRLTSHIVGMSDVDGNGMSGIEKAFDGLLSREADPLRLALDVRVQRVVRDELARHIEEFSAKAGNALVLDTQTGAIVAMASLPDFDPNHRDRLDRRALFNRNTQGVYEVGSMFKLLTVAGALETGAVSIDSSFDVSEPLRIGRHTINDYHGQYRLLSVPEVIVYSSNVAASKIALSMGRDRQRDFLYRLGMLERHPIELPKGEVARPDWPQSWSDIHTATISFGHGIAVSPLHLADAVSTIVNGGVRHPATLLDVPDEGARPGAQVLPREISDLLRWMMWLNVATDEGSGTLAAVPGYMVGGKTGTAEKAGRGGYKKRNLLSSFIAAFPMNAPRYVVLVMLDEPQGIQETWGYATGGWVAAPAVGRIIQRIGPLLEVPPVAYAREEVFWTCVQKREARNGRSGRTETGFAAGCTHF